MNLLYVDDNLEHLTIFQARLQSLGYNVLATADGGEALKIFSGATVDLAVVDYYMPGTCGGVVAVAMKKIKPQVPIILFSGILTLPEIVLALVDGFVSTSDDPDALVNTIADVLQGNRRVRVG